MNFHNYLANGLEVLIKENHFSKMIALQCWVKVGSLHERPDQRGMAHLIEHMLFKGTEKRAVGEIAATVETCGGDINAYTTFDRTVFYLTLGSEHLKTGLDILADAIFNSSFDPDELKKEQEVVIEEIRRSNDNPSALVGRKIFEYLFKGSEAGRPIIGYEDDIKSYERHHIKEFHGDWYQPQNISLVVVGDLSTTTALQCVEMFFGPYKNTGSLHFQYPERQPLEDLGVCLLKGDYEQPRLEICFPGPELEHLDTAALDIAAFALGSGDSSSFNRKLRDQLGVVTAAGASLYSTKFGGIFFCSSYPREETFLLAAEKLAEEIMLLKYHDPISDGDLARARANLKSDRIYEEETVAGQAKALGFGLMTSQKYYYDDVYFSLINNMPKVAVADAVNRWVDETKPVIIGMLPKHSKITEQELNSAYLKGIGNVKKTDPILSLYLAEKNQETSAGDPCLFQVNEAVKLVYRFNPHCDLFTIVAATEGGLRAETKETAGLFNGLANLLGRATISLQYDDLLKIVEGKGAILEGFSGKDSFGLKLQCLSEQSQELLDVFFDCLVNPQFPEEQFLTFLREVKQQIKSQDDLPSTICLRKFQEQIFPEHPYRHPIYGTKDSVERLELPKIFQFFKNYISSGPWVLGCVGPLEENTVVDLVKKHCQHLKPLAQRRHFPLSEKSRHFIPASAEIHLPKDREQTHVAIGFRGLTWNDQDRYALDVLQTILGGSGGRLFINLRDKESLAYTVVPLLTYGCDPGIFATYIACSPEKKSKAIEHLIAELDLIAHQMPQPEELERAVNNIIGNHENEQQRSESQAMTMALMELYGYGYNDFLTYPEKIKRVTSEDVTKVARRLFRAEHRVIVTVGNH